MENQNEQVFEADQDVNAFERLPSTSTHKGRDTLRAVSGWFTSQQNTEDDRTPLLGGDRGRDQRGSTSPSNGRGDDSTTPVWEGERDFEGRPWWNMPSVRTIAMWSWRGAKISMITGLLASPSLRPLHNGFWWRRCPTARSDHFPHLPPILLRSISK